MKKKVFVSYRHTSEDFSSRVLELANWFDQTADFESIVDAKWQERDRTWWDWSRDQIYGADVVLVVCNHDYNEAWGKLVWGQGDKGRGSAVEAHFIKSILAEHPQSLGKVRFLVLDRTDADHIPIECKRFPFFDWSDIAERQALTSSLHSSSLGIAPPVETEALSPSWIVYPRIPADARDNSYARRLLDPVEKLKERSRAEAERKVRQKVVNIMGNLTERFGATSSWLFLKSAEAAKGDIWIRPGDRISLEYYHNTGIRNLEREASETGNGIVGYVAATGRPYLSNDLNQDPYYQVCVESSAAELAVPILCVDADGEERLIGVFNLESNQRNAFLEAHRGELVAAATEFAPEILIHHYLRQNPDAFGWHPETAGWTLERLLEDFCCAISASVEDGGAQHRNGAAEKLAMPSCTVWYLDREEERLYVRGTARFDYEYVNRRGLGSGSFTSKIAHLPPGFIGCGEPGDLTEFQRPHKSRNMGMVMAFAAPIHLPITRDGDSSVGTVNLYFFGEELKEANESIDDLKARFPKWVVPELARALGRLIDGTQRLRIEVAAAYLRHRLHEHALPGLTDFETVKEVILSCLDADGCSIFAREAPDKGRKLGMLRCLATTGLRRFDGTSVDLKDIYYDLDALEEQGIAAFLARQPNQTLRCRSTVDLRARQCTLGLDAVNKYRETYSHTDTEHRPFLGISVDDPIAPQNLPTGIVRVLRRSGSKPFVHTDDRLLRRIIRDCHFLFYRWRESCFSREEQEQSAIRGARFPFLVRVVGNVISQPKLDAIGHLGTEFVPGAIWNRRQVDAVLLDLINLFRNPDRKKNKQGGLIANFRLTQPASVVSDRQARIFAIHAPLSSDPPPEELLVPHESAGTSIGLRTIEQRQATTFDPDCSLFRSILNESENVVSGACMPMRLLSERGVVWGVLSIDCDDLEFEDWKEEHLLVLALAAKKLDFVGRDNRLRDETVYQSDNWREAMTTFILMLRKTMRLDVCNVEKSDLQPFFALPGEQKEILKRVFTGMADFPEESIGRWSTRGGFEMPLSFGAFDTKLKLIGRFSKFRTGPPATEDWMASRIVEIGQLWNRFTNSRVGTGVTPLFKLSFVEGHVHDRIRTWDDHVEIASDVFGRGPVPFP